MLQANFGQIEQRQADFDLMVSDLENNIRILETSTNRSMLEHERRTILEAQNYAGCLWDHFNQVITEHEKSFTETIEASHARYQQELMQQSHRVRQFENDRQKKIAIAFDWLTAAQSFCEFIEQNYAHEAFTPGILDRLRSVISGTARTRKWPF